MAKIKWNLDDESYADIQHRESLTKDYNKFLKSLKPEHKEFLRQYLGNKDWRMNNLYWIRDKYARLQKMQLNYAQRIVYFAEHNKQIVLKSRQQGISTHKISDSLDDCLFIPGTSAGIQSYGLDESNKLQQRADLMLEKMDPRLMHILGLEIVSNNSKGITFSNGSILKIGNFRGDTLQKLHVSELAKISNKFPDKALELKTGAFQAVATNAQISIESTAEGTVNNMFYDMFTKAWAKKLSGTKLSPLDFEAIFISWLEDPDCNLDMDMPLTPEANDYIEYIDKEYNLKLTRSQQNWLVGKLDELGDDFNREYPATPDLAFKQSTEGSYFLKQYNRLMAEKRIIYDRDLYDPSAPVEVSWDFGINDEMVLLFAQRRDGYPRIIDEYHNSGEGIPHYVDVLNALTRKRGYRYSAHYVPHDAKVRDLGLGITRLKLLRKLGLRHIRVLPKLPFKDSIDLARLFINAMVIVEKKCPNTLAAIQMYKKKYDKQVGVYLDTDVHNIHSNYAAALRYMAQGMKIRSILKSPALLDINKQIDRKGEYNAKIARRKLSSNNDFTVI